MSVPPIARRRAAAVGVTLLAILLLLGFVARQWSVSYADAAPQVAPIAPSDPTTLAEKTYLIDCAHDPVVRPASFTLTCGDANIAIQHTTWSKWGGAKATGTATYIENTCDPYCAAGKFVRYPVKVTAQRLLRKDGAGYYRTIVVFFLRDAPKWVKHHRASFDVSYEPKA